MNRRRGKRSQVLLTNQALQDLISIEEYSIKNWGNRVANDYLDQIQAALERISGNPEILREEPNFHQSLFFHRINRHLLVCDVQRNAVFVLTVLHAEMDIPERLVELEPVLRIEVETLHRQLEQIRRKGSRP